MCPNGDKLTIHRQQGQKHFFFFLKEMKTNEVSTRGSKMGRLQVNWSHLLRLAAQRERTTCIQVSAFEVIVKVLQGTTSVLKGTTLQGTTFQVTALRQEHCKCTEDPLVGFAVTPDKWQPDVQPLLPLSVGDPVLVLVHSSIGKQEVKGEESNGQWV